MFSVFLSSYRNPHESFGELEKAVEKLACEREITLKLKNERLKKGIKILL